MELIEFAEDVAIIQKLGTFPNAEDGLTDEDLKKKFDEAPALIKDYLNSQVVPAVRKAQKNAHLLMNIDREDDGSWSTDKDYDTILQEHSAGREIGCNLEMSDETRLYVPFARWDGETFAFSTVYDGKEWRVEISKGDDGETSVQVVSDAYDLQPLCVTITGNQVDGYTADVSFKDILAAHEQGRDVRCFVGSATLYSHTINNDKAVFQTVSGAAHRRVTILPDSTVGNELFVYALDGDVVKTVNGVAPDENGNIEIQVSGGNASNFDLYRIGAKIISGEIPKIILMGDSITDGHGGTGYNGSKSNALSTNTEGYCWANVFKKFVEGRYGVTVTNNGMWGTAAAAQVARAKQYLTGTELVIWLTGTNNRNSESNFTDYLDNMAQYISELQEICAELVVVSCVPASNNDEKTRYKSTAEICEALVKTVVGKAYFIDMRKMFIEYCDVHTLTIAETLSDGLHPNDLGYWIIFKMLCNTIGLPIPTYIDYKYGGEWWETPSDSGGGSGGEGGEEGGGGSDGEGGETLLVDTGINDTGRAFANWSNNIIPVMQMAQFDANNHTTLFSGVTLSKIMVGGAGFSEGTLTVGTVPLNTFGGELAMENTAVVDVGSDGVIDFGEGGFAVPANHTVAMGAESDTARLSYESNGSTTDNEMSTASQWTKGTLPNPKIRLIAAFYRK